MSCSSHRHVQIEIFHKQQVSSYDPQTQLKKNASSQACSSQDHVLTFSSFFFPQLCKLLSKEGECGSNAPCSHEHVTMRWNPSPKLNQIKPKLSQD